MNIKYLLSYILLLLCVFSLPVKSCSEWQYASLSFTNRAKIQNDELKDVYTFVFWNAPNEYGMWQNGKPLSGNIKITLTEYFKIDKVHALSILNKIGTSGWEAYGFHTIQESESDQTRQWQFKKCKNLK
ncbi:hypothetical protein [Pleionea sediminis]|uniref:hypothetical protein n=1 Tax=Pleionea sediminis TaxID=2569479 RepID=UPI0011846D67|nr:hypothetical protein [Pleionea sediminis]